MSVVSGVTLICGLGETGSADPDVYDDDGTLLLKKLNAYLGSLEEHRSPEFVELSDQYGGYKHPQHLVFGAGINYLDEDRFAKEILSWPWKNPENVVLIIQPEEGDTRVFRPGYAER